MAEPFLSEIRIFSFNFPTQGWAFCNGQLLPINQNQALFSLLGTRYGGNGQTNFALPNLRGRVPIHMADGFDLGQAGGQSSHTITQSEMPQHIHFLQGTSSTANQVIPTNRLSAVTPNAIYSSPSNFIPCKPESVTNVGGSQPHNNMMPYLVLNFCIALQGLFPTQN
jgi:microcystin-dependent protein